MRIRVTEIAPRWGGDFRVNFEAAAGTGGGIWRSASAPEAGRSYDVEFTLDRIVDLDKNATRSEERRPFLKLDGERVVLNGVVEEIDRERIGSLRLSPDCLVMLDFADPRINVGDWLTLTAEVSECDLYAFGA